MPTMERGSKHFVEINRWVFIKQQLSLKLFEENYLTCFLIYSILNSRYGLSSKLFLVGRDMSASPTKW